MSNIYTYIGPPITWKLSGGSGYINLSGLVHGLAAQGSKIDFGENKAENWLFRLTIFTSVAPVATNAAYIYWGGSPNSVANLENPANLIGISGAYTGYVGDVANAIRQLDYVGTFIPSACSGFQTQDIGIISLRHRYGMPVVYNMLGATLGSNDNNILSAYPIIYVNT